MYNIQKKQRKKINRIEMVFILSSILFIFFFVGCNEVDNFYNAKNEWVNKIQKEEGLKKYDLANLSSDPRVEFVLDPNSKRSIDCFKNIRKVCDYSKIPFNFLTLSNWNSNAKINKNTRVLVILDTKPVATKTINKILEFVAEGGVLFLPNAIEDIRFNFFIGLKSDASMNFDVVSKGIFFDGRILPGIKKTKIKESQGNYSLSEENFSNEIEIYAKGGTFKKLPIIITNEIGYGKVVYFNTSILMERRDRGLFFSSLLHGIEGIPYPVANTSTIFLDDFPSPIYDDISEPIKTEMNITNREYVHKVWWEDMKQLADKHKIKYTALVAFDYNTKIKAPFLFEQWDAQKKIIDGKNEIISDWLVKDLINNNHEVGFHGYNHVSLLKHDWKDSIQIELSLHAVKKKWLLGGFGDHPITYVPPTNKIDAFGIEHLHKNLPSVKYLCSLYEGEKEEGEYREFDFDPYEQELFDYPRISSGFSMEDYHRYNLQSLFLYTGIWTHFLHPDDVYQIPKGFVKKSHQFELRNKERRFWKKDLPGKESLLSCFESFLEEFKEDYAFTKYYTVKEAVPIVMDWRASKYVHKESKKRYEVIKEETNQNLRNLNYWFVYFDEKNCAEAEKEIKKIAKKYHSIDLLNGKLFQIVTEKSAISLPIFKIKNKNRVKEVFEEYEMYTILQEKYLAETSNNEDYFEKIENEKCQLLEIMLNQEKIDYFIWNKYATYLSWENNNSIVWDILKDHCKKYPSVHNVNYSLELEKMVWFPDEETQFYWLLKRAKWNPENLKILKEYLSILDSEKDKIEYEKVLKQIYILEKTDKNLADYISFLTLNNKKQAIIELDFIKANQRNFSNELVSDITWLYEGEGNYYKALEWAPFTNLIPFELQLEWMFLLKQYVELINAYEVYISNHPEDIKVKAKMASIYHMMGKYDEAWKLASELENNELKEELKKNLNADVVFLNESLQDQLLNLYPEFFTDESKNKILENRRLAYGNFIEGNSSISTFVKDKINFKNQVSYTLFDSLKNTHTILFSQEELYPVKDSQFAIVDKDNINKKVYGLNYLYRRIKRETNNNKIILSSAVGLEVDNKSDLYYNIKAGLSKETSSSSNSVEINYLPVNTSASYEKKIYNLKLSGSNSFQAYHLQFENYFEGRYYTNNEFSLELTAKVSTKQNIKKWCRLNPYVEVYGLKSSIKKEQYYPYFIIPKQIFGGGGFIMNFGKEIHLLKFSTQGGYYFDSYAKHFINSRGNFEYNFMKFAYFKGSYDVFFQDKYFSNTFSLGFKYIF